MLDIKDKVRLYKGDCLEVMDKLINEGIIVDAIITDPPYGTTKCKWDNVIPIDEMWKRLNKLIKPNGAIVLFGSEPFSSALRMSNIKNYKYDWKWNKIQGTGFSACKKQPLRVIEDIMIFYKNQPTYNPQMTTRDKIIDSSNWKQDKIISETSRFISKNNSLAQKVYKEKYPVNYIEINRALKECNNSKRVHPTQKPVELMEYLIKTYTKENEVVLDFTMGSGSTGVACINTNRNFIGIEKDDKYFDIAKDRINQMLRTDQL
ncbi:DNA-methyltransferase [Gemella morbillorum]